MLWVCVCLPEFSLATPARAPAQFVEISAHIELASRRSDKPNAEASAPTKLISVRCLAGPQTWRIENDYSANGVNKWFLDGTNVYESIQIVRPLPDDMEKKLGAGQLAFPDAPWEAVRSNLTVNIWPSADGHPLGDVGVNIPWLAFYSGPSLAHGFIGCTPNSAGFTPAAT
jgi:hypothetical protein